MSTVNTINAAAATSSTTTPTTSTASGSQSLTQQDFLKIMVAEFTQQDPLSSGDSGGSNSGTSDYVNQLMSMTSLTTMQTMSSQQAVQLMGSLPGSTVQLSVNDNPISGVVQDASLNNGAVYITVNGTQYPASDLVGITQTAAQAAAAATTASTTPATTTN